MVQKMTFSDQNTTFSAQIIILNNKSNSVSYFPERYYKSYSTFPIFRNGVIKVTAPFLFSETLL